MFRHVFVNRLKCLLRDRQLIFWTFLFPAVVGTLFTLAFSNINSSMAFKSIPIAVVKNPEYEANAAFKLALESVSSGDGDSESSLFQVEYLSEEEAMIRLENKQIKGYIHFDSGAKVVVNDSGIGQTILKQFMDSFLQASSAYTNIIGQSPKAFANLRQPETMYYLKPIAPGNAEPDSILIYYYALIAMASLSGGFWGMREIMDMEANQSARGVRLNLAPVHKLKMYAYSFPAAILIQFLSTALLVAYLSLVLGINFGSQLGYILLACLAGSTTGVTFGAFIGAVVKGSESIKSAVLLTVTLMLSFLSGLMISNIKYIIARAVPIFSYISPANLISDAFYSLYYYSTYERYFINIGLLFVFSAVFTLIVYFVTRRQRYANI